MIPSLAVGVAVDGTLVAGAVGAQVVGGTVMAPLHPFCDRIAVEIRVSADGRSVMLASGGTRVTVQVGSRVAHVGTAVEMLPIAPFLRDGRLILPLASIARELGATVVYDGPGRLLAIQRATAAPLATMTPFAGTSDPQASPRMVAPEPPTPVPSVFGIPQPRRTPVVETPARPTLTPGSGS